MPMPQRRLKNPAADEYPREQPGGNDTDDCRGRATQFYRNIRPSEITPADQSFCYDKDPEGSTASFVSKYVNNTVKPTVGLGTEPITTHQEFQANWSGEGLSLIHI